MYHDPTHIPKEKPHQFYTQSRYAISNPPGGMRVVSLHCNPCRAISGNDQGETSFSSLKRFFFDATSAFRRVYSFPPIGRFPLIFYAILTPLRSGKIWGENRIVQVGMPFRRTQYCTKMAKLSWFKSGKFWQNCMIFSLFFFFQKRKILIDCNFVKI